jgi:hypothetical protein
MPEALYQVSVTSGGVTVQKNLTVEGDSSQTHEVTLPAGFAGSLTTRTSDTAGTVTVTEGAGNFTDGDVVNIWWDGGVAYGATIGTQVGAAAPLTGFAGAVLPAADTAVVMTKQVAAVSNLDGDEANIVALQLSYAGEDVGYGKGHINLQDASNNSIEAITLAGAVPYVYYLENAGGSSNPFTGAPITKFKATNFDTELAATLTVIIIQDGTP